MFFRQVTAVSSRHTWFRKAVFCHLLLAGLATAPTRAEVNEVTISRSFGLSYLPTMVMEREALIEKQAAKAGIAGLKTSYASQAGPNAMTDAMLSGSLHFAVIGPPSLALIWDRTGGGVKGLGAVAAYDMFLNTRNPNIKTLKDFTEKDRIAVPAVKIATSAVLLQMAAEKEFGPGQQFKLDPLTVGLGHPDAMAAVLNPTGDVNAHFATSPFHEAEMKAGFRTITTANAINGGNTTQILFVSTEKFRAENPKVFAAVDAAFIDAMAWINADLKRAVRLYLEMSKDKKTTEEEAYAMVTQPGYAYARNPRKVENIANYMARVGLIKTKPKSWKDMFFAEAHGLEGD